MNATAPAQRSRISVLSSGRVVSIFALALSCLMITSSLGAQSSAVRVEDFFLQPGGEVKVENACGSTRVEAWTGNTVRVVAEKTAPPGSFLDPAELMLMGAGNTVIVQCRRTSGTSRVDLTVYVPQLSQLNLTGGTQPVDVAGALASAIVQTTSGSIDYKMPSDDDARVSMRTSRGTVRSTVPLAVSQRSAQSIQGQLRNGSAMIVLNSQTGNITLTPGPSTGLAARNAPLQSDTADATDAGQSRNQRSSQRPSAQQSADLNDDAEVQTAGNRPQAPGARSKSSSGPSASNNGSFVFAGADQGVDSQQTTRSGKLVRPRTQRDTSGGDSGLKVRIIPSDAPRNTAGSSDASADDQLDDQDFDSGNQKAGKKSGSQSSSNAANTPPASSSSGSFVFAGSDQSLKGESTVKTGPIMRPIEKKQMGGGSSGLKVRIIPAPPAARPDVETITMGDRSSATSRNNSTLSSPQSPRPSVYRSGSATQAPRFDRAPAGDGGPQADTEPDDSARVQPVPRPAVRRDDSSRDQDYGSIFPKPGAPPSLHRGDAEDAAEPPEEARTSASRSSKADDEAVVLKAALVNLNVSVTNRAGVALPSLKKEDFQVAENGQQQRIEFFQPTTAPFNLVLVLDLSGSIQEKLDVVKSAALRFVDVAGPQDKIAVVTFTDRIKLVSQLTSDRDELKRRIRAVEKPMGGTAFYEALWFTLVDTLRATRGQRNAIVVMTDGVDSSLDRYNPASTRVTFAQLSRRLEEADVIVFPIYLDTEYEEVFERGNSTSEAYAIARDQLAKVAEQTGGQLYQAEKVSDLSNVYKQVAAAIRTVYSVGYYPTNPEKDGTYRRVRVSVDRADAAVRTRRGYYAK